ncbi:hypothetical protein HHK36_031481 [Tetracentron sinense]|uniref:Uncharacterized protein n=1 Tax=Tetracentron sinense TaxID=13715 RepID=A0A834YBA8_TETSI|nr:hypothetical protein HHK36_031481 [Tetracentron sinense]
MVKLAGEDGYRKAKIAGLQLQPGESSLSYRTEAHGSPWGCSGTALATPVGRISEGSRGDLQNTTSSVRVRGVVEIRRILIRNGGRRRGFGPFVGSKALKGTFRFEEGIGSKEVLRSRWTVGGLKVPDFIFSIHIDEIHIEMGWVRGYRSKVTYLHERLLSHPSSSGQQLTTVQPSCSVPIIFPGVAVSSRVVPRSSSPFLALIKFIIPSPAAAGSGICSSSSKFSSSCLTRILSGWIFNSGETKVHLSLFQSRSKPTDLYL